jgi:hypothetical protein
MGYWMGHSSVAKLDRWRGALVGSEDGVLDGALVGTFVGGEDGVLDGALVGGEDGAI